MASVASQLIQEVTAHPQSDSLEDAREICADGTYFPNNLRKGKGKAVSLQAWTGPDGSRKLRLPDFVTTAQDVGRLSVLRTGRFLLPRKYSWYSFLREAESTPGP